MNYRRLLENIKRQINKVATFFKTREVVTFLFFLLLAFGLWYMHSSGTQRELRDTLHINYVGIPENILLDQPLPTNITFVVKDEGKQLWQYSSTILDTIQVDLSSQFLSGSRLEIEFEKHLQKILLQLSPTARVIELSPGYFTTSYIRLDSKEIPVRLSNQIKLAPQHVLSGPIKILPEKVLIYGQKTNIDTIDYLYLQSYDEELFNSKTIELKIDPIDNVSFSHSKVSVTIPVEMCTEKEIEVPIIKKNVPDDCYVKTFPSTVKVKFSVALSLYNSVFSNSIEVIFDYNKAIMSNKLGTGDLELNKSPNFISNIQVNPTEVEYVIEKPKK